MACGTRLWSGHAIEMIPPGLSYGYRQTGVWGKMGWDFVCVFTSVCLVL